MRVDYTNVTEVPGFGATEEALRALHTRYAFAADRAADKDVLEVAAGPGFGLGWFARKAKRVVGTDITTRLVKEARTTYAGRIDVATADAQALPFQDASFDVVLLYEAIYYVPDAATFLAEARRILRPEGELILCTANKRRPGFVKSPHSRRYYAGQELLALFERAGFDRAELKLAFAAVSPTAKSRILAAGLTTADKLRLIPRTLEGRAGFKRVLFGELAPTPRELKPGDAEIEPLVAWNEKDEPRYKVIYATARCAERAVEPPKPAPPQLGPGYRAAKRALDLAACATGLVVLSPVLVGLAVWVKLDTPGPAFYRGRRAGRGGSEFRIWKFRSMVMNADKIGGPTTSDDDPRVTRSGHFIRKYKMDELAQLMNVLVGDMSLVGPRPDVPSEIEKLTPAERALILGVKPGMTDYASIKFHNEGEIVRGYADAHQAYETLIRPGKIRLQKKYAKEASFGTDLRIIGRTFATLAGTRFGRKEDPE